ncbi:hypothetical protein DEDE109153_05335 [Deinococcus deserti]
MTVMVCRFWQVLKKVNSAWPLRITPPHDQHQERRKQDHY